MKIFSADRELPLLSREEIKSNQNRDAMHDFSLSSYNLRADNTIINSGKELYQPSWVASTFYTPAMLVRLSRVTKSVAQQFACRYYEEARLGVLMCCTFEEGIMPEHFAYSLDSSLVMSQTDWQSIGNVLSILEQLFVGEMEIEHRKLVNVSEHLHIPDMEFISAQVALLSRYFLLKIGDIIALPLWNYYRELPVNGNVIIGDTGEEKKEILYFGLR